MNEWEAKYKALLMAIDNPIYIENAKHMVKVAADLSSMTAIPFEQLFHSMREIIGYQQGEDTFFRIKEADKDSCICCEKGTCFVCGRGFLET